MKVKVHKDKMRITIPVPLWLCELILKWVPIDQVTPEQKNEIIQCVKTCFRESKRYKGLRIVEVETATGEYVSVTL